MLLAMALLSRRSFLRAGAATGIGAGLLPLLPAVAGTTEPRIRRTVQLGRTGLRASDIGFGSDSLKDQVDLVRHALDRGITYFDTAERYHEGLAEKTLGRALEGVRDHVVLVSKLRTEPDEDWSSMMGRLEAILGRLRTDRLDVCFNHAVNDLARLKNPGWGEFLERATQAGKIRWRGMSGHGSRLVECLDYAIDNDLVDVILVAFNFGQDPNFRPGFMEKLRWLSVQPDLPRVLRKARQKDVGIVAMKTLRGGKRNDMRPYEKDGATFAQAAFRWVFSTGLVDSLIVTMHDRDQLDEYLGASGWLAPKVADISLLSTYEELHGDTQCRYGCSACAESCPAAVPISDVLRARMYAVDYENPTQGRNAYADLGRAAQACVSCAERSCHCPYGVRISELTDQAHRLLG